MTINPRMLTGACTVGAVMWVGIIMLFVAACGDVTPTTPPGTPPPAVIVTGDLEEIRSACDQFGNRIYSRPPAWGGAIAVSPKDPSCPQGVR